MRSVRGRGWAAAATAIVLVAVTGSAPVSADVVVPAAPSSRPTALSGDFNGDGRPDIALVGASGWDGVSTALRTASNGYTVGYTRSPAFAAWASLPGVKIVTGKFDNDADDDIVLTGLAGWSTLKLARSDGNGTFTVTNTAAGSFPAWAGVDGARLLSGDFNGDGRTDLALAGGDTVSTIPVALANANGTFTVTNNPAPQLAGHAQHWAARVFAQDLNADGRTDLVLVPGEDALLTDLSLTVAYSTISGGFSESSIPLADFVGATYRTAITVGDFNHDHRADLAVVLDDRIVVARSLGAGSFAWYEAEATADFFLRAHRPGARIVGSDTTCDGRTDLVVLSGPDDQWTSVPVAMSAQLTEEFFVVDEGLPNFPLQTGMPGTQLLIDDFDSDGCEDLALTGGTGWNSVHFAMAAGDGSYSELDIASPNFAAWAAGASPVTLPPPPAETLGTLSLLDTGITSGITPSAAVGTDGLGIISYYSGSNEVPMNLRVAHCEDVACTSVTATDVDVAGDVGRWSSIRIGSDGLPLISYAHERNLNPAAFTEDLKVAHCNNIACTSATVTTLDTASRVNDVTSLAIGGDGFGLISYQDTASSTSTKMKVAHCLNLACTSANLATIDTVKPDNGETGGYSQTGIAVGNHGMGLISYYDGAPNEMLKVAACTNVDCSTTVKSIVDRAPSGFTGLYGGYSSVAYGRDGLALISYNVYNSSVTGTNLKVAHCLDVYCTTSTTITADTGGYVGWHTSIAIGGDGLGVISYSDGTNKDLKLAHCTNLACTSATATTVDSFDNVGDRSSVTTGADGLPLISYMGPGFLDVILRVVRCGNSTCTAVIVAPF